MAKLNEGYLGQAKTIAQMQKWNQRIKMTESILSKSGRTMPLERKAALAVTLENTNRLLESTQAANIGQYKRYALDLVQAVVPNLIAFDLFSVQPLENRVGMINYVKYTQANAKGSSPAGKEFASAINYTGSDYLYTDPTVDGEALVNTTGNTYSGNLEWTPVRPQSVSIDAGNGIKIVDNGSGALVATSGLNTSADATIDYATGAYTFTLAGAAAETPTATYLHDNEYVPAEVPQIDLSIESLPITTKSRKLKALYSFDASYELQKEYGTDINDILASQAAAEISYEIDTELQLDALRVANAGPTLTWSMAQPTGVNLIDHYDSLYAKIINGSNTIFKATGRAKASYIVAGVEAASVIEASRNFKAADISGTPVGPHYIGTYGTLKAYINPNLPAREFFLGYKGDTLFDAGIVYAPYMPILSTDVITLDDFMGRRGWATMYGKKVVNNKMYLKGVVTD